MKQFRFLAITLAASMILLFSSCGSGGSEKKADEKNPDTTQAKTTPEVTAPAKLKNVVIIKHKVANYAKWKIAYEADDSARHANGLSSYALGRGLDKDSNTVVVILKSDNIIKAKEFSSSTELKDVMQKAGVVGAPGISYIEVVMNDDSKIEQTDRVMVSHKVKDWDEWKRVFDSHKQSRIDAGFIDRGLGYASGDRHSVSIVFAITDMAKAKAFIASKDLKDKMAEAGVEGPPTFFYYKVVQTY